MTDAIQAAHQARSELRQTEAAFEAMKRQACTDWMASKPADEAYREQLYRTVSLLDAVRNHLVQIVATGDMEETELAFLKAREPA